MRAVVQRVASASVRVNDDVVGRIDEAGLLVFVGAALDDDEHLAERLAVRVHDLRILDGDRSAADLGAPLLVVSQFTLYADTRKGRRPSYTAAAPAAQAEPLVEHFIATLRRRGARVATGRFGAHMHVELVNDGPVTIIMETTR